MASVPTISLPPQFIAFLTLSLLTPLLLHFILTSHRRRKFLSLNPSHTHGPSYPVHPLLYGLDFTYTNTLNIIHARFASGIQSFFHLYGNTFYAHIIRKKVILTIEPENLECVMSSRGRFGDFDIINARRKLVRTLFGEGIFSAGGREWGDSKRFVRTAMGKLDLDAGIYERCFGGGFEFREVAFGYTLSVSCALILGDCGDGEGEGMRQFGEDFSYLGGISSALTIFNGQIPFLANLLFGRKFSNAKARVNDFVDRQVRLVLERGEGKDGQVVGEEGKKKTSVMEGFLTQTDDKEKFRRECLNLLLAGHATVGISLSELLYYLARYPDVWRKLRDEVAGLEGRVPTFAQLKGMRYLGWVINEVTRLRPILSVHGRMTVNDTVLPRGGGKDGSEALFVERGTYIVYSNYALHRNADVFGDDVEEFRPERWADVKPGRFEYLPFGAGPRACPGKEMGWTMMAYAVVRLAQEIEAIEAVDDKPWEEAVSFSFFNRHGVWVRMVPVQG